MRKLLITRGVQGSGKSSAVRALGLDDYRLCPDDIRNLVASPALGAHGRMETSHEHEPRVWGMLRSILSERMERGEFTVVDATHQGEADLALYGRLAREHRYEVGCLDFAGFPLDRALAQNARRPENRRVSEHVLRRTHQRLDWPLPASVSRFAWSPDGAHAAALAAWLDVPVLDLSGYRRVVHVGDVQGCFAPLAGPGGLLADGLRDDTMYLFVGDLLDRGPENGRVMEWFARNAGRANVRVHWGNHEDHLHRWAVGKEPVSWEFEHRTLPQLRRAGFGPEHAEALCAGLADVTLYDWRGTRVMVSHAGLSTVPERPALVPSRQYSKGTGFYESPVDQQFDEFAPPGWHQVHGHRNHGGRPVAASRRSFNLEDSVEFGGSLRAVVLDADGFAPLAVRNHTYTPFRERRHMKHSIVPAWMSRPDDGGLRAAAPEVERMLAHTVNGKPAVRAKSSARYPHVVSLNFDKNVFYDGSWDDVTVRARGLFLNRDTWEVVARSYDKFFNVSERDDHTPEALASRLAFPVTLYVKENGFLGILGYDRVTDDLFFASKSTPDVRPGFEFADWFREIAEAALGPGRREELRRFLRDTESSMAFEVIDPARDPHMIEYDAPKAVLLDVFRRALDTEKLPYDDLCRVGRRFGLEVKEKAMVFRDWPSLNGWMRKAAKDVDWQWQGRFLEGFVLEDSAGFQTKVKLGHYSFWKAMRGVKDRVGKAMERAAAERAPTTQALDAIRPVHDGGFKGWVWSRPEAVEFLDWCKRQSPGTLRADILTLRRAFRADLRADAERRPDAPAPGM